MQSSEPTSAVTPTPVTVRKRDGKTLQPFNTQKIINAVRKAWREIDSLVDENELAQLAAFVSVSFSSETADVEKIQDAVELALMRAGRYQVAKQYILYRQRRSAARQNRLRPDPLAISNYIHASKYARYVPELQRREVYDETVARVEHMHLKRFAAVEGMGEEITRAFDLVRAKRMLPSMRSMQFGGAAVEANNFRLFNCSASLVDRPRVFAEAMFLLLSGCGVGYSVQFEHVEKLPPIAFQGKTVRYHVVQDTIEGWADAVDALVNAAIEGVYVEFSYDRIRTAGTPLKTSGGRAPGHRKLKDSLEHVREVLRGAQGRQLRPIECHQMMCHIADAVLSGGIRRCLPAGTLVHLNRGLVPIEQVRVGDLVRTAKGFQPVTEVIDQGEQALMEITSNMGTFRCTPNHRMAVLTSTSTYAWKRADELLPEDRLVFVDHVLEGTRTALPSWSYERSPADHTSVDITVPELTPDVGWFLGYLHGNGYVHVNRTSPEGGSNTVSFSMNADDPETPARAARLHKVLQAFGVTSRGVDLSGERTHRVSASGKQLALYLETFKRPSEPLEVPACVREGTPDVRAAYLAGLFDSDGGAKNRPVLLVASVYPAFLAQVQAVYASLGVPTRLKLNRKQQGKWQPLYHLTLSGELPRKHFDTRVARWAVKQATPRTGAQRDYGYPREWILREGVEYGTHWSPTSAQMTTGTYERCGGSRRGLMPITVLGTKMVDGMSATYDISVRDEHEFVANGLLVHNSAMISLFSIEDGEMMNCKVDPAWFTRAPWFANANNSAVAVRREVTERQFKLLFRSTRAYGEPGVLFVDHRDHVTNPCSEVGLDPCLVLEDGTRKTGWAACNLCEINAAALTNLNDFMEVARAATLIGTLQATYTDFPYLGPVTEAIVRRDALLGIGMTGMQDAPHIACNPDYQRQVAEACVQWNREFAARLGINTAARTTVVKPAGTSTLQLGITGSGIHPAHAPRYIRRVTADELEVVFQAFKAANPHMCVRKPDGKWVIEFAVEAPADAKFRKDFGAIEFCEMVRSTQENWVLPGTQREGTVPGIRNNVSNTITVRDHEWDDVANWIWEHRDELTGISLLSDYGDTAYPFAPFEAVHTEAQERRWNELVAGYKPVDYYAMLEAEDGTNLSGEAACAGGACSIA